MKHAKGFTLVELSIVLVIIGLLIGGILAGQSMISTARIQAQIRQFNQYDITITNFKLKYNQIPGDCNICVNSAETYGVGNNDGLIEDWNGNVPVVSAKGESGHFFADMYTMGILSQQFIGSVGPNNPISATWGITHYEGFNGDYAYPAAKIGRGGLLVLSNGLGNLFYNFIYSQGGASGDGYLGLQWNGNFSPAEALAIDTKIDDGLPSSGNVASAKRVLGATTDFYPLVPETVNNSCIKTGSPNTYNTALTDTSSCRLMVESSFQE